MGEVVAQRARPKRVEPVVHTPDVSTFRPEEACRVLGVRIRVTRMLHERLHRMCIERRRGRVRVTARKLGG